MARIILTTGGTGGHVFPAEALAEILLQRGHDVTMCLDARFFHKSQTRAEKILIQSGAPGGGIRKKIMALAKLLVGYLQSVTLLTQHRPDVVVGFGGYTSLPVLFAARLLRIPMVLHEQNALLGRVNRLFANYAKTLATSAAEVTGLEPRWAGKVHQTGNPVRPAIAALADQTYHAPNDSDPIHLFVMGGSQGARVFNDAVPGALGLLPVALRQRVQVVQQVRAEDILTVQAQYQQLGIQAELQAFFNDVPVRLAWCHLLVARAGASTLAEIAAANRPAILVPYPYAKDDHQMVNAKAFASAGAAQVVKDSDCKAEALSALLLSLFSNPSQLSQMAASSALLHHPKAAEMLADIVEYSAKP